MTQDAPCAQVCSHACERTVEATAEHTGSYSLFCSLSNGFCREAVRLEVVCAAAESLRSGGPRMRLVLHVRRHLPQSAPTCSEDTYTRSSRPIRYDIEIAQVGLRPHSNLILVLNGAEAIFWSSARLKPQLSTRPVTDVESGAYGYSV
jgi:hypothetical protein